MDFGVENGRIPIRSLVTVGVSMVAVESGKAGQEFTAAQFRRWQDSVDEDDQHLRERQTHQQQRQGCEARHQVIRATSH